MTAYLNLILLKQPEQMNSDYFKRAVLPHIIAIGGFIFVLAVYFSPAFFSGKNLLQNDILQGLAAGHEAVEFRNKTGEEPLWTNSMFSGMPLYLINTVFTGEFINEIRILSTAFFPKPADTVFLNFICFYIMLAVMRVRPLIAFLGAFAYAFGTYNIISVEAGHIFKVRAIAFMPLVFAGVTLLFRKQWILGLALSSLAVALELGAQHYQITYYLFLLMSVFFVNELIHYFREKKIVLYFQVIALLAVAGVLGLGTSFGRIWALQEYGKYSIRGKSELTPVNNNAVSTGGLDRDYAFAWSQGITETLTLLVPNLFGGASNTEVGKNSETYKTLQSQGVPQESIKEFTKNVPTYWGDQPFTSGPVYAGIVVLFLFVLGMFVLKPEEKYWALAAVLLSFMLAWGKNFETLNYFMFDYFPAYNKFRAVSMAMTISLFCFPLIAALTLERIVSGINREEVVKQLTRAGITVGGLLFLIYLYTLTTAPGDYASPEVDENLMKQKLDWLVDAIRADRKGMLVKDTWRSLFFVGAAFAVIWMYLKDKMNEFVTLAVIALLSVTDLYMVDKRYLNSDNFTDETVATYFTPMPVDEMILQDKDPDYRVFNVQNPFNEARTSYFHKSIGGYHGAKLRRYQDIIERHLSNNNIAVLNMLNAKYIVTGDPKNPVQKNPGALGNAWFVGKVIPVNNPDEEINALKDFNPSSVAYYDKSKFTVNGNDFDSTGSIKLTEYKPNHLKYSVSSSGKSFAVFSEIYYPEGWSATIDGNPAEIKRVNYILRGLEVPAGNHTIEFTFKPAVYAIGNKVMFASSSVVALLLLGGIAFAFIKRDKVKNS
jgi:hypothetical protein